MLSRKKRTRQQRKAPRLLQPMPIPASAIGKGKPFARMFYGIAMGVKTAR